MKPRPLAVIRNRRLNSVALLAPLRSVQFSSVQFSSLHFTSVLVVVYLPSVLVFALAFFLFWAKWLADQIAVRVWCVG